MRLFFLFLLIINVLFSVWIYTQPEKQVKVAPPLPAGLETVQLLHASDEAPPAVAEQDAAPKGTAVAPDPVPASPAPRCYTLGPFNDEAAVDAVRGQLSEKLTNMNVRRREEKERHRYWVYIPPLKTREQAIRLGEELGRKKIRDYYVLRGGEDNNSISLGHFKEKKHADQRIKQLSRLGFDVQMEVIYRQYNLYWLDYEAGSPDFDDASLVEAYLGDGVARLDRDCAQ